MRLLLTSGGISNPSIHDALVNLLGKSIAESNALVIPTAVYPFPEGPEMAWRAISGRAQSPLAELGWKSLGVLELTALPTIRERVGSPGSERPTRCSSGAEMSSTCVTGCGGRGWQTCCPR
jgi:dipeptidase E